MIKKAEKKARQTLETAVSHHQNNNFRKAREIYLKLLKNGYFVAKASELMGVLLAQTNRLAEAKKYFEKSIRVEPDAESTYNNYCSAFETAGDIPGAIAICRQGLAQIPDSILLRKKLCNYSIQNKDYEEAASVGNEILTHEPSDFATLCQLNAAYFFLDDRDKATECGMRALHARDGDTTAYYQELGPLIDESHINKPPSQNGAQIIAFSLWGDKEFYTLGALRNAELASQIYPGWTCRFYCGPSVPEVIITQLKKRGCQIYMMDRDAGYSSAAWRFLVACDPGVKRFICRDADSRFNIREAAAVRSWIKSGKPFHIIRDSIVHCDVMLAGLWGGVGGTLPNIQTLMSRFLKNTGKFADQTFLAHHVWPAIKDHAYITDSTYRLFNANPFPDGVDLEGPLHVGAGVPVSMDPPTGPIE